MPAVVNNVMRGGIQAEPIARALLALKGHDANTYRHSLTVAVYAKQIATNLRLPATEVARIHAGALVHDIGKLFFTERLLSGATPLNNEERLLCQYE